MSQHNLTIDVETGEYIVLSEIGHAKAEELLAEKIRERDNTVTTNEKFTISTEIGRLKRAVTKWREDNPIPIINFNMLMDFADYLRLRHSNPSEAYEEYPEYAELEGILVKEFQEEVFKSRGDGPRPRLKDSDWHPFFYAKMIVPLFEEALDIPKKDRINPDRLNRLHLNPDRLNNR